MGEIYKAQDSRLQRFVAIKVLSAEKAGNADMRRRFVQEAQAASSLNHPNIITIYDIVSEGDTDFMVLEYLNGQSLAEIVNRGPMPIPQVIYVGVQVADAVAAAHAAGIVHRDLKPANVMVTETGRVKVLDFGLAKMTFAAPLEHAGPDAATTAMGPMTMEGSVIGTVNYMSPEQAEGKRVDGRSDIFSFGLLLYEMVTGRRGFQSDSILSTLTSILRGISGGAGSTEVSGARRSTR
jgi:serine/threonine-protein kinase